MSDKAIDIIAAGYPSLDRIIKLSSAPRTGFTSIIEDRGDEVLHFGGCNINVAYTAARLGLKSMPACYVGGDFESSGFKSFLADGGVLLDALTVLPGEATPRTYMIEDREGNHITLFYPGAMKGRIHEVPESALAGARYCVITVGEPLSNLAVAKKAAGLGVPIVFGMKCDFNTFGEDDLEFLLRSSEIIFMNEHERNEIQAFLGLERIELLLEQGVCKCLITTMGSDGSRIEYRSGDGSMARERIPLIPADRLADTSGVGDSYIAGFLAGLSSGADYKRAALCGAVTASFIAEGEGCLDMVPDRNMVNERAMKYLQQELL